MKPGDYAKLSLLVAALVMMGFSVGCSVVGSTTAAAVGTVSIVTYSVYEGGESVVTGVGNIGSGGDEEKPKDTETVVFYGKVLKVECNGSVEEVWLTAVHVLRRANFQELVGNYDLLSGELEARTWDRKPISLKLKSVDQDHTLLWIWTGPAGNLKASEQIHKLIADELKKRSARTATGSKESN